MFSNLHTRRGTYRLVVWALVGVEGFFGWRAGLMYSSVLSGLADGYELTAIIIALSISLGVFGFFLATHRQQALEAMEDRLRARQKKGYLTDKQLTKSLRRANRAITAAVGLVVLHDLAGALYTTLHNVTAFGQITIPLGVVALGMSALAVVPFLVGPATQALADGLAEERRTQLANEAVELTFGIQIGALRRKAQQARHQDPDAILASPLLRMLSAGTLDETQRDAITDLLQANSSPTPPRTVVEEPPAPAPLPAFPASPTQELPPLEDVPNGDYSLVQWSEIPEPANTITDAQLVVASVAAPKASKSNGHKKAETGGQATERRPFRGFGWRKRDQDDEEDDDWKGWEQ